MRRANIRMFRQGRLSLHLIPILIWVTAAVAVGALFLQRAERYEVVGLAVGETCEVAATTNGRVKSLAAKLFEHVHTGETLAVINIVLDGQNPLDSLEAKRQTILAGIARLDAELVAAKQQVDIDLADRESQRQAEYRRLAVDLEQARIAVLQLQVEIEPDRLRLKDLELEVRVEKDLLAKDAVDPYQLEKAQTDYDTLKAKIEQNEQLLAQANKDVRETSLRLARFEERQPVDPLPDVTLEPIRKAITVQRRMIDELLIEQVAGFESLQLAAPFDGVVSKIQRRPGEAVLLGEPVMTIARPAPDTVIAWVREDKIDRLREGKAVKLVTTGSSPQVAMSEVTVVGPSVEMLPERLWRTPSVPEYGLPFQVGIPPGLRLKPQEKVGVKLM